MNDIPVVTIFAPVNTSQWAGVNDIIFNVNNDGEGLLTQHYTSGSYSLGSSI